MNLIQKIRMAIERGNLIPPATRVVVGVSGGADSVALLHLLHRLGYSLTVAHLNHSIRGEVADADQTFVRALCALLGVECVSKKVDVPALAKRTGVSIEMAAREARHQFFQTMGSLAVVCLAHHADDQLETFFLRVARGSGPSGLGGMRASQKMGSVQLVRPMLQIRRTEIVRWLEQERLEWREDASNADEAIARNLVRHQILPHLGALNARAAENMLRTMAILRDEAEDLGRAARRRDARDWLIQHGVAPSFDAVERLMEFSVREKGTQFLDLEGVRVANEYGVLRVLSDRDRLVPAIRVEEGTGILRGVDQASVSLVKIAGRAVCVRPVVPGDRMNPYGMQGSKKLQDIFTDLKIPRLQRARWPVVECGGEIIWVPGYRIARGWELRCSTERALHLFAEEFDDEGSMSALSLG